MVPISSHFLANLLHNILILVKLLNIVRVNHMFESIYTWFPFMLVDDLYREQGVWNNS